MTDHEHMPPVQTMSAELFSPGKIMVTLYDSRFVLSWDEAHALATAITEQLALERRP